jgi:hypothetical protein
MVPQSNEEKRKMLFPEQREALDAFGKTIDTVIKTHPEFHENGHENSIKALEARRQFALDSMIEERNRNNAAIGDTGATTTKQLNAKSMAEYKRFIEDMDKKRVEKLIRPFGVDGARANKILDEELNPGIAGSLVKNVYDKNKGGPQWGGIIGAALGLLAGFFGGPMLGGGWMSVLAIVGGTLLGSWLGKKAGDAMSGPEAPATTEPSTEQVKAQGKSQQIENTLAPADEKKLASILKSAQKKDEPSKEGEHVDDTQSGQLAAPRQPVARPQEETQSPGTAGPG